MHLAYIERVYVEVVPDEDPDLSYLTQEYPGDPAAAEMRAQDAERLAAYKRDEWSMVGVRVVAEVTQDREGRIDQPLVLKSAGIWGIESDSGREYALETGRNELGDLREQLAGLRFTAAELDEALKEPLELSDSVGMTEPRPALDDVAASPEPASAGAESPLEI
jgi:hypothetical protein